MKIGIVGGGISGLYCALCLSEKHSVLLFDEREYIGGRIKTLRHMELGAARFNRSHRILFTLIRRYGLTPVALPRHYDYLLDGTLYKHASQALDACIKHIVKNTVMSERLRNITFYDHCISILGKDETDLMVSVFGYYTEIKVMNAYDAIHTFRNDFVATQYYALAEGLSALCSKMAADIRANGSVLYTKERVTHATAHCLTSPKRSVQVDKVIFCTKARQLNDFPVLKPIHSYLSALHEAPLLRIYARYKTVWFKDLNRMTTNNVLRQIIPIDKEKGIIMVSYTDGADTAPFLPLLKNPVDLAAMIEHNLKCLFPEHNIPKPLSITPYFWKVGTHAWKPGNNAKEIFNAVIHPLEDVYVCGEAYSTQQAWMEGGLFMASKVIDKINS